VAGETLLTAGRRAKGESEVQRALDFFRSVDAKLFVERAEAVLAQAQRDSA
jgi:hypothetical protein